MREWHSHKTSGTALSIWPLNLNWPKSVCGALLSCAFWAPSPPPNQHKPITELRCWTSSRPRESLVGLVVLAYSLHATIHAACDKGTSCSHAVTVIVTCTYVKARLSIRLLYDQIRYECLNLSKLAALNIKGWALIRPTLTPLAYLGVTDS